MIRVSMISGNEPIMLVAPHGANDVGTATLVTNIAKRLDFNAIVNHGFEISNHVDVCKDLADCDKVDHLLKPVVFDEFLKPLIKLKNKIIMPTMGTWQRKNKDAMIFYIMGVDNNIHKEANEEVGIILGCGRGKKKDSFTCRSWRKNLVTDLWRCHCNFGEAYEGRGDGKHSGRNANCLNQYFRKHTREPSVNSMQIKLPLSLLENALPLTELALTKVFKNFIAYNSYDQDAYPKFI